MKKRGNRHEIVLATKFTSGYKSSWEDQPIHVNYTGNSAKSLHVSVEDSLKKLQTDYIDLLYVHWWYVFDPSLCNDRDYTTSIEELAHSLGALVQRGKVLYLAVSDTPAWVVSQFNQYAKDHVPSSQMYLISGSYPIFGLPRSLECRGT
jgi:aryl-alcohol dehydrogenase-like predicted oxidoreductase